MVMPTTLSGKVTVNMSSPEAAAARGAQAKPTSAMSVFLLQIFMSNPFSAPVGPCRAIVLCRNDAGDFRYLGSPPVL